MGKSRTSSVNIRASWFLKWRHLADRSCISVAPHLTDNSRTNTIKIRVLFFLGVEWWNSTGGIPPVKWRPLVDRSCISVAPDNSRINTVQIRVSYFLNDVKMALEVM